MAMSQCYCSCCGRPIAYQFWDIVSGEARSDLRREDCYGGESMDGRKVHAAYSASRKLKEVLGEESPFWNVCFSAETPDIVTIGGKEYKFKGELLNRSDAKCKITVLEEVV